MQSVRLTVRIERKRSNLPAFVIVPSARVAAWGLSATTVVEVQLHGAHLGRKSLKRWGAERWFIELRRDELRVLGLEPGDRARLAIELADAALPPELQRLIDADAQARQRWLSLTQAQQRMLREEIFAAKSATTRERRSRRALLPCVAPAPKRSSQGPDARSSHRRL